MHLSNPLLPHAPGGGTCAITLLLLSGCFNGAGPTPSPPEGPDALGPPTAVNPSRLVEVTEVTLEGGVAIWLYNGTAYVTTGGGHSRAVEILDVADPAGPRSIGYVGPEHATTGNLGAFDIDVLDRGDRRIVAISEGGPLSLFDVSDPQDPFEVGRFAITSHGLAIHPEAGIVYNAVATGPPRGSVEIIDASDPQRPRLLRVWEFPPAATDGTPILTSGCHDITVVKETARAYCAAVTQTLVWDVSDPRQPRVLTAITNPLITLHHVAFPILNHTVLVVGDEPGGSAVYACTGQAPTALGGTVAAPVGAVWFYDLAATPPALLGWFSAPAPPPGTAPPCTAHFGMEVAPGSGYIIMAWFRNGLVLIDARDPANPALVDHVLQGQAVFDARMHEGHVYATLGGLSPLDSRVGLAVFRPT